jgi:hypothetical protein
VGLYVAPFPFLKGNIIMTRDEVKKQMRLEFETDLSEDERNDRSLAVGDRLVSATDLIQEIEEGTALGEYLVDDYIKFHDTDNQDYHYKTMTEVLSDFNQNKPISDVDTLSEADRKAVLALMQDDLDYASKELPGWADEPCADDGDRELTPRQLFQEVKDGTDFGNRYAMTWLVRHELMNELMAYTDKIETDRAKLN